MPNKGKQNGAKQNGAKKPRATRQYAALPYVERDGETMVMLVTSRETQRWVLPKGWAEKKLTGAELAAKEAYEEAGLRGEVADQPVGSYAYQKRLANAATVRLQVDVYPLKVERELKRWPEKRERQRRWFSLAEAAMAVEEGELVTLLLRLAAPT